MRIRVVLDLKDKKIPVQYHSLLQGIIYNSLYNYDKIQTIHDQGFTLGKRKFKLFTYSEIYGDTQYLEQSRELHFSDTGYFDFTSYDDEITVAFINFITQNNTLLFGKQLIKVLAYNLLDDFCDNTKIETYTTLSPITSYITDENKKTKYFEPTTEEFKQAIIQNLAKKYYLIYKENMSEIEISDINSVKKKKIYFRSNFTIAYHLTLTISGLTPQIKKVILTCGIGSKNSSGLGMVNKKRNEKKNISN